MERLWGTQEELEEWKYSVLSHMNSQLNLKLEKRHEQLLSR